MSYIKPQEKTFKEFRQLLGLSPRQESMMKSLMEAFVEKWKRPEDEKYMYQNGQVDAFNSIWKLVEGINDDYTDKIFKTNIDKKDNYERESKES